MEVLFENNYIRNKELAKEIYQYYYFKRKSKVVFYVIFFLLFLTNVLLAIFEKIVNWEAFLFITIYFLLNLYFYFTQVNTILKHDNEVHGKEVSFEMIVTDENIQTTSSIGSVAKLEYDKIRSVIQTKNLILLRSKANLIYTFRKDGFTKGNKEDFIIFLNSKGIKIK